MALGGQRQHPRVQLDTAVRVRRGGDGPWLHARALDLSEGGVRVQVHEGMPVGAEVRCSLPLLGARGSDLELLGTVAWVEGTGERHDTKTLVRLGAHESEPALERRSMGLRFSPLPANDAERLRTAVRGATARPCDVVLALEGRSEPVTARAEPTADGLMLRAPLPVVRVGAAVGVRFASDGNSVVGVVKSVSLGTQEGAPELRIELGGRDPNAAEPASSAEQGERPSGSSGALMNPASEAEPGADADYDPDETVEVFVPAAIARGASTGFVVAVALACLALGVVIGAGLAQRMPALLLPRANSANQQALSSVPVARPTVAPAAGATAPAVPEAVQAQSSTAGAGLPLTGAAAGPPLALTGQAPTAVAAGPILAPSEATPTASAATTAADPAQPPMSPSSADQALAAAPAADPAAPSAAAAAAQPATGQPSDTPVPDVEPAVEAAGQGLQVSTLGRVTRVRIPITGSGDGMRVYDLSSPGLTVNLPAADTPVRLGNFAVNTGLARRVWLRKLDVGLQVRVIYNRGAVRPEVSAQNGALTIDLSL
jgi:hypothetical protein